MGATVANLADTSRFDALVRRLFSEALQKDK